MTRSKTPFINADRFALPPFLEGIKLPNRSNKDSKARKSDRVARQLENHARIQSFSDLLSGK